MRFQGKPEGSGASEEHDAIPSDLSIEKKAKFLSQSMIVFARQGVWSCYPYLYATINH